MEILFALSVFLLIYTYALYPLLLELLPLREPPVPCLQRTPTVSILVSAFNEERHIRMRIQNLLRLNYPPECLEILIGSDGSTDDTVALALSLSDPRVKVRAFSDRSGKPSVLKRLVAEAEGEILVFTDANVRFEPDALEKLVTHFEDSRVGGVCGRLILGGDTQTHEGPYWRMENRLKWRESLLDSCLGANGGIYAIRRDAWPDIPANVLVDDFVIAMRVREQGLRVVYEREALAYEDLPVTVRQEMVRRIRIGAGDFQSLFLCRRLLSPRFGAFAFAFWSHKVLRWSAPFLMTLAFVSNAFLLDNPLCYWLFCGQLSFYGLALLGGGLEQKGVLAIPHYFVTLNLALMMGFFKYLFGSQSVAWQRTER